MKLFRNVLRPHTLVNSTFRYLASALLFACSAAIAGTAYGKVTTSDGPFSTELPFTGQQNNRKESVRVRTDGEGRYEVILPPGEYLIDSENGPFRRTPSLSSMSLNNRTFN
jgi:hypothetical protein